MATSTRRQPVAQGGLFSTPKASFSKETQELLKGERDWVTSNQMDLFKCSNETEWQYLLLSFCTPMYHCIVMMQESKLTNFQQRRLKESMMSKFTFWRHTSFSGYLILDSLFRWGVPASTVSAHLQQARQWPFSGQPASQEEERTTEPQAGSPE